MIGRVLFLMAFPVILLQALWVVMRAQKLPEASGARTGSAGHGPPLRILIGWRFFKPRASVWVT